MIETALAVIMGEEYDCNRPKSALLSLCTHRAICPWKVRRGGVLPVVGRLRHTVLVTAPPQALAAPTRI